LSGYHVYQADSCEGPFTSTRYYHVTAVDHKIPPNESPESNPGEADPIASVGPDMFLID